jgi:hypothetical protein
MFFTLLNGTWQKNEELSSVHLNSMAVMASPLRKWLFGGGWLARAAVILLGTRCVILALAVPLPRKTSPPIATTVNP